MQSYRSESFKQFSASTFQDMVQHWSPEPPQESNDVESNSHSENIVVFETDESDGEYNASDGYQLLPADDAALESDEESLNREENVSSAAQTSSIDPNNISNLLPNLPLCDSGVDIDLPPRADIVVDSDRIQAAMAQFTLPPSAIPSWASVIPESQWTHHLMSRINALQNQRN